MAATTGAVVSGGTANSVVREARYVLTNLAGNNNKFWNIRLYSDGGTETHWGRVGEAGQRKYATSFTEEQFLSRCREKERGGYRPQKTIGNGAETNGRAGENTRLAQAALEQIETSSEETRALVMWLARANVHQILEATTLQYDESRGTFSTPLGIVTREGIDEARGLLSRIGALAAGEDWDNPEFAGLLNDYLMLIPRNIGRSRVEGRTLFPDRESIVKESQLLDSLESSLQIALLSPAEAAAKPLPRLFEARLQLVDDTREIERIRRKFEATLQARHASSELAVKRVYRIEIGGMARAFAENAGTNSNVQELWHGTRAGNLLSILKSGFVIPAANASHCTGRMFGNGVYFSDQSTKSLNYASGYWSGGHHSGRCFMFLCDVAMGRTYTPASSAERLPAAGYDSTFARAGASGVLNNEMIVYSTNRINPRFLVEFGPKDA